MIRISLVCKKEICFLLDTTTFSTIVPVQFSCLCSFKRGLLQSWCSVACLESSFIRQLFYMDKFLTMSWILVNHYKVGNFGVSDVLRTRCSCVSIVCWGLCFWFVPWDEFFTMLWASRCCSWAMRSLRHHRSYDDLCHLMIEQFQFWRLVAQTQTFIGSYGRPKFVCLLCW